jgi:hypothetical protein
VNHLGKLASADKLFQIRRVVFIREGQDRF